MPPLRTGARGGALPRAAGPLRVAAPTLPSPLARNVTSGPRCAGKVKEIFTFAGECEPGQEQY